MTALVILAVLVPVGLAARSVARERALDSAQREAAVIVAALAITNDPAAVELVIAAVDPDWRDRIGVHGLGRSSLGVWHARTADVQSAADQGAPSVVPVSGGLSYLEPVNLGAGHVAVAEIFVPDEELSRGVAGSWLLLGCIAVTLLVIGLVPADRVVARAAGAARALAAAARALGDGDLTVRAPVQGSCEVAEAAATFNVMAGRVAAQLTAERELIADRSHRLRTPLTALRLEAERLGPTAAAARLAQAVEAMEREVDHVIHTARRSTEAGPLDQEEVCDAAEVVRERMNFWAAVAEDQSRPFAVFGTAMRAPVPLARGDLAAALDALLGNVFRYTPQGTPFEVEVSRRGGYVAVRVDDAGPGIADPKGALRRGASARGSTGLGLDIVRGAAVAGRGGVHIDRAALGGTSVVVLLADAHALPAASRQLRGFVGRLSREPGERRWGRRARAARGAGLDGSAVRTSGLRSGSEAILMSFLSLAARLSERWRRR